MSTADRLFAFARARSRLNSGGWCGAAPARPRRRRRAQHSPATNCMTSQVVTCRGHTLQHQLLLDSSNGTEYRETYIILIPRQRYIISVPITRALN
ncbi:unnamed protein product [Arctia plantaginis]|uniref:Uncharacterized protein n=1 Tax=Arctia plantaginis TaxID=874455 RepID=A0A8S1B8N3_ARCPL|nr:unnamed protein product [Arctia plantaginis]